MYTFGTRYPDVLCRFIRIKPTKNLEDVMAKDVARVEWCN